MYSGSDNVPSTTCGRRKQVIVATITHRTEERRHMDRGGVPVGGAGGDAPVPAPREREGTRQTACTVADVIHASMAGRSCTSSAHIGTLALRSIYVSAVVLV